MIILPAIDLKDGNCVRLLRGDFDTVHQVADSVDETAEVFRAAGARWIHMVDLDGARSGGRPNFAHIARIAAAGTLRVETGGGIKTIADVETCLAAGIARVVIGSAAVTNPNVIAHAAKHYPNRTAVGIDALDGKIRTHGWERDSALDYIDFAQQMEELGVKYFIFTDIATDGMLTGPSYARLAALQRAVSCDIIASGGVSSLEDIKRLRDMGLYGAIIGKAYYAGKIDLAEAIRVGGTQA